MSERGSVVKQEDVVVLVAYDTAWPGIFERERSALTAALDQLAVSITHVGSTAVPDLAAKPIIDILIESNELPEPASRIQGREASPMARAIEACGYEIGPNNGGYVRCFKQDPRCHLWTYLAGDVRAENFILFADYLRKHHDEAMEYQGLKQRLVLNNPNDVAAYTLAKRAFVDRILDLARASSPG
jgi:GrpB-like predicted nucleotidyltransferase (UPF0157 family)